MNTAPLPPLQEHTHVFGDWRPIDGMFYLRKRYCIFNGCNEIEYGVFASDNRFLRQVSLQKVKIFMDEVQEATERNRRTKMQIENEAQERLIQAHAQLERELLSAKLRLTGGV